MYVLSLGINQNKNYMEKIELKHIAPYLPYGLKFYDLLNEITHNVVGIIEDEIYAKEVNGDCYSWYYKESDELPILRPLSDLTKEIEHNGERFVPIDKVIRSMNFYNELSICHVVEDYKLWSVREYELLLEWHFDVFDLHSKGLCLYYNEL